MLSVGSTGFWYTLKTAVFGHKVVPDLPEENYAGQNQVENAVGWLRHIGGTCLRVIFRGPILACFWTND